MSELIENLTNLFTETSQAHHQAFVEANGEDPEWAIWYAEYLQDRLPQYLGQKLTKSEIIYCLVSLSRRQMTEEAAGRSWMQYYAAYFAKHYAR